MSEVELPKFYSGEKKEGHEISWMAEKITVGKRVLTISRSTGDRLMEFNFSHKTIVTPHLQIQLHWRRPTYAKCSLGHDHPTGKPSESWDNLSIPDEYVDQLVAWLQEKPWTKIKTRKIDRTAQVLKESREFFIQLEEVLPAFKVTFRDLIRKIEAIEQGDN